MTRKPIVFLKHLEGAAYAPVIEKTLEQIGFFQTVAPGARVFLKPNLTFPQFRPGVMTSLECLRAVTVCLIGRGYRVVIGEADSGGYNRFSIDEVFKGMGIDQLAAETGAEIVNVSFTEREWMEVRAGWRTLRVPVPWTRDRSRRAFFS